MINTMKALIKREFWEHRGAFKKVPVITGLIIVFITLGFYITMLILASKSGAEDYIAMAIAEISNLSEDNLTLLWHGEIIGLSTLYIFILYIVLFFYLLGSLFDDRKDLSILFWKSLPISDSMTVASKLLTAMLIVPMVFTIVFLLTLLTLMVLGSIVLLFHGLNPIDLVWSPVNLFSAAALMLMGVFVQMLWALPIYGWLVFSSAISKRRPFLFAVFIPAIISFSWYWINVLAFKFTEFEMFTIPLKYIGHTILPYGSGTLGDESFSFDVEDGYTLREIVSRILSSTQDRDILYGFMFFGICIGAAIWIRRYRNTI